MRRLPFELDRSKAEPLNRQLEGLLRRAIMSGVWKSGERLPTRAEMCAALGIGDNTVRAAMRTLVAEGLVRVRPRLGCEVVGRPGRRIGGRLLHIIVEDFGSYHQANYVSALRNAVGDAGFSYSQVGVPNHMSQHTKSAKAYARLEIELAAGPDLCVIYTNFPSGQPVFRRLEKAGIPYIVCGSHDFADRPGRYFQGMVSPVCDRAIEDFAADCLRARICSVCEFNFGVPWNIALRSRLESGGVNTETVNVDDGSRFDALGDYMAAGRRAVLRRLAAGPLPDLMFFADDYMTIGALQALAEAGVRVPGDVRVVTLSNRGFELPAAVSLARLECDSAERAAITAEMVVSWFHTGRCETRKTCPFRYVRGDSFPV